MWVLALEIGVLLLLPPYLPGTGLPVSLTPFLVYV